MVASLTKNALPSIIEVFKRLYTRLHALLRVVDPRVRVVDCEVDV